MDFVAFFFACLIVSALVMILGIFAGAWSFSSTEVSVKNDSLTNNLENTDNPNSPHNDFETV